MKRLLLVRHAKSGWDADIVSDFDRRLTKQGNKDAEEMALLIHKNILPIDTIISSPAKRALSTAQYFANAYDMDFNDIIVDLGLYEKNEIYAKRYLATQSDSINTILLVAHNPMLTKLTISLTNAEITPLDACSVVCIEFPVEHWQNVEKHIGMLLFIEAPL